MASEMSSSSANTRGLSGSTEISKWSPVKNSPTASVMTRSSTVSASRSMSCFETPPSAGTIHRARVKVEAYPK